MTRSRQFKQPSIWAQYRGGFSTHTAVAVGMFGVMILITGFVLLMINGYFRNYNFGNLAGLHSTPTLTPATATVKEVWGKAEIKHGTDDQAAWSPLVENELIVSGDEIRTGVDGLVTIAIPGGSETRVNHQSLLTYAFGVNTKNARQIGVTVKQLMGEIYHLVIENSGNQLTYTVLTPNFVMTATENSSSNTFVSTEPVEATVQTVSGVVVVAPPDGNEATTTNLVEAQQIITDPNHQGLTIWNIPTKQPNSSWIIANMQLDKTNAIH